MLINTLFSARRKINNTYGIHKLLAIILWGLTSSLASAAELKIRFQDDAGNAVKNAVVAVIPVNAEAATEQRRAEVDQRNFKFVPDVLVIRTNTLVHFPNSDDVRHHVYSFSPAKKFELRLYHGKTAEPVLFDQPGKVVLGCNIHDSMVANIYVVDTPWFAQSDQEGLAVIENLPAGSYRLSIYHPYSKIDYPEQPLDIAVDEQVKKVVRLEGLVNPASNNTNEYSNLFE